MESSSPKDITIPRGLAAGQRFHSSRRFSLKRLGHYLPHKKSSWFVLVVYSLIGAATTVIGSRVVRTKWFYSGNYQENYYSGLQSIDILNFLLYFVAILVGTCAVLVLYKFLLAKIPLRKQAANPAVVFCVSWVVIFLCWVPYFMANFPCSLYADSIVIIKQALGINALTSHHPIAYVGLIGLFLHLGKALFDSYIMGIALYTAAQMVFMSGAFAYMLAWMARRRISVLALFIMGALLALLHIFPLHAVSMWKDGLYASFVLLLSLVLFDIAESRGALLEKPTVLIRLGLWSLLTCLIRSNGLYVVALVWVALILLYTISIKQKRFRWGLLLACAISMGAFFGVVGPLSDQLNVKTEPVESYGIPLQQVAAVVVYDGTMTEEQRDFLNTLLPLNEYKEEYIPCSVDGIKWATHFDTEFFDSHQKEFIEMWASLAPANLDLYAAAYIMESYEYWSFADIARTFTLNGVNDKYDAPDLGIIETNLLDVWFGSTIKDLFPFKFFHLQEGAQSWIVLFAGLMLFIARREKWSGPTEPQLGRHARIATEGAVPLPTERENVFKRHWWLFLLPTVANWLTVLISSPFAALPRYILPAVFILPVIIVLPWLVESCEDLEK